MTTQQYVKYTHYAWLEYGGVNQYGNIPSIQQLHNMAPHPPALPQINSACLKLQTHMHDIALPRDSKSYGVCVIAVYTELTTWLLTGAMGCITSRHGAFLHTCLVTMVKATLVIALAK
jgi:hypothetical protein